MKGIILAGGSGSRLGPITLATSKQLLPIYNKPMVYYPLSTLISAGIQDILIITTPQDHSAFVSLLGDGSCLGISLQYDIQPYPKGIAEAFLIGRQFIGSDSVTLILGDNIFIGDSFTNALAKAAINHSGAKIFGCTVSNPSGYGVIEFGPDHTINRIIEKPLNPPSNFAVVGLYVYDNSVIDVASAIKPSKRGELEITDVNNIYLENQALSVERASKWDIWIDAGTYDSLLEAGNLVAAIEKRQGIKVGCPRESAIYSGLLKCSKQ